VKETFFENTVTYLFFFEGGGARRGVGLLIVHTVDAGLVPDSLSSTGRRSTSSSKSSCSNWTDAPWRRVWVARQCRMLTTSWTNREHSVGFERLQPAAMSSKHKKIYKKYNAQLIFYMIGILIWMAVAVPGCVNARPQWGWSEDIIAEGQFRSFIRLVISVNALKQITSRIIITHSNCIMKSDHSGSSLKRD